MATFEELVDKLDEPRTPSDDPVIVEAQAALASLYDPRGSQDWQSWLKVGAALKQGRDQCIRNAGANGPFGKKYKAAFKLWLEDNGFAERPDKSLRSNLIEVMENLPLIEEWREHHLTDKERARKNNPDTVLRKWRADQAVQAGSKKHQSADKDKIENLMRVIGTVSDHARKVWPDDANVPERVRYLAALMDMSPIEIREFGRACLAYDCSLSSTITNTPPVRAADIEGELDDE
jgi:hypothetical protein